MIEAAVLVIFPMLVAFGGASDFLTMTIQNRVSILLIAGFVILALATGLSASGWATHAIGLLLVFFVCFGFFTAGWMGGGDVKFISAIALWIGMTPELGVFVFLVAIYGMGLTFALLSFRTIEVVPVGLATQDWFARLHDKRNGVPYGIAIAVAGLQIYPSTGWFALAAQGL